MPVTNNANVQETSEDSGKHPKKHSVWFLINALYVLLVIFSGGFIWCLVTLKTVIFFLPVQIILCIMLRNTYKKYKADKKMKMRLYILRIAALAVTAVIFISPLWIIKFENNRTAYQIKRFAYVYGVGNTRTCRKLLPRSLPSDCRDYKFITMGSLGGQDYHPSSYLIFHTDSDTLRNYEEHMRSLGTAERYVNEPKSYKGYADETDKWLKCPEQLPQHVYARFCNYITDDLDNAVIFVVRDSYSGCLLNYETGLAVFWT